MGDVESGGEADRGQSVTVDADDDGANGGVDGAEPASDAAAADNAESEAVDGESVPEIELALYQAEVAVRGRADDDLADVESTARDLMDHLAELAQDLEEPPADIGLG